MRYHAVLFDFDYTLGDATESIVSGFRHAFEKMGLPEPAEGAVRRTVGYLLKDGYTMLSLSGCSRRSAAPCSPKPPGCCPASGRCWRP